ncbi:MAG: hypothetical protein ACC662_06805, partial [Planctomycetota bacterium]
MTISCAVGLSLVVSLTVIPTATAFFLRPGRHGEEDATEEAAAACAAGATARVPAWLRPLVLPFDLVARA